MIGLRIMPLLLLAAAPAAHAATVFDPANDILPSYTGVQSPDLDVLSFTVNLNGPATIFTLGFTVNGVIDPAAPGFYVIGVNTGTGVIRPFADIGNPDVIFNQAFVVQKTGAITLGGTSIGSASIVGNAASLSLPVSLFPSTGFTPGNYGFNIWPRGTGTGNPQITDFAPDNATLAAVPEPGSWALMLLGYAALGAMIRRRGKKRSLLQQIA